MNHISLYIKGSPAELLKRLAWEDYRKGNISEEDYQRIVKQLMKK